MTRSMFLLVAPLVLVSTAHAVSPVSATASLKIVGDEMTLTESVAYRRCWWRGGKQVCRYVRYRTYSYYAYYGHFSGSGYAISPILGIRH
jgi:hypothetical protein